MSMQYLSKTDFLKYQCCPSYMWLWKHKKEVVPTDEAETIKQRFEQGNEVSQQLRVSSILIAKPDAIGEWLIVGARNIEFALSDEITEAQRIILEYPID